MSEPVTLWTQLVVLIASIAVAILQIIVALDTYRTHWNVKEAQRKLDKKQRLIDEKLGVVK